jgi:hypothetical protein
VDIPPVIRAAVRRSPAPQSANAAAQARPAYHTRPADRPDAALASGGAGASRVATRAKGFTASVVVTVRPRRPSSGRRKACSARAFGGRKPPRQPPVGADQAEVRDGVRDLGAPARLQVREQLQAPGVVRAMVQPAQRHDAVAVIAAAERPRHEMRGRDALVCRQTMQAEPTIFSRCASEAANGALGSPGRAVSERSGARRRGVVR